MDGSLAQALLKKDINNNKHKTLTPKQLHNSKDKYKEFKLEVFCKHIHQEVNTRKYIAHCKAKSNNST